MNIKHQKNDQNPINMSEIDKKDIFYKINFLPIKISSKSYVLTSYNKAVKSSLVMFFEDSHFR